jgi:5'-deoxy-5'-methylthioadenosine phosphorylase
MTDLAIIGGTGLTALEGLDVLGREAVGTPWGEPSGPLVHGRFLGRPLIFLARHGEASTVPPHRVNYRANLWALREAGARSVIAVNAVGGIRRGLDVPGRIAVPDQILDYTYGRAHTFFEDGLDHVVHIDFTEPYCQALREVLIQAGRAVGLEVADRSVYGATQGPRLETAAEVDRLERDGCDIVGMTGMPEAALARELDLCYATVAVVANAAAGRGPGALTMEEIDRNLKDGMASVRRLLAQAIPQVTPTARAGRP